MLVRFIGFTTQALAKCSKMIPVLLVATLVYKKTFILRHWLAASLILLGCTTYLLSDFDISTSSETSSKNHGHSTIGGLLILAYLFFDGLTSTTQEKVFGRIPNDLSPFSSHSPVLDQMVWTGVFSSLFSLLISLVSYDTLLHSLQLLSHSSTLCIDIFMMSLTSTLGLFLILNSIASFGALTTSTIMTSRQFLSILINGNAFGNLVGVGFGGWLGIGWVAGGLVIKMDTRFDEDLAGERVELLKVFNFEEDEKDHHSLDLHDLEMEGNGEVVPKSRGISCKCMASFVRYHKLINMMHSIETIWISHYITHHYSRYHFFPHHQVDFGFRHYDLSCTKPILF